MTDTLFDLPEQKSPRLLWIEKHGIETLHVPYEDESGMDVGWYAWRINDGECLDEVIHYGHEYGFGATEADAITDWSRKNDVRLWNEEKV